MKCSSLILYVHPKHGCIFICEPFVAPQNTEKTMGSLETDEELNASEK